MPGSHNRFNKLNSASALIVNWVTIPASCFWAFRGNERWATAYIIVSAGGSIPAEGLSGAVNCDIAISYMFQAHLLLHPPIVVVNDNLVSGGDHHFLDIVLPFDTVGTAGLVDLALNLLSPSLFEDLLGLFSSCDD